MCLFVCACACARACARVCVPVCACMRVRAHVGPCVFMCMPVCTCVECVHRRVGKKRAHTIVCMFVHM